MCSPFWHIGSILTRRHYVLFTYSMCHYLFGVYFALSTALMINWRHEINVWRRKRDNQAGLDNRVEYNCICHPGGILFKACISRKDLKSTGCSVRSGVEEVNEREIFQGSENRLIMIQTYSRRFQCVFALGNYPFDVQVPWQIKDYNWTTSWTKT